MAGGSVEAARAVVPFDADLSPLNNQVAAALGPLTSKFGKLGSTAKVGLGAVVVGAGAASVALYKVGQEFDDASDTIRVGTGATGKHLKGLEKDFRNVVKGVPTDFGSAATAVADLNTKLGITGKPLQRLSKQFTELSRITKTDVGTNVQTVSRLFGDWSVATGKQSKTLDGLFRVSQASGIQVDELASKLVQFGSPMRQLGFDLDFAASMFARFEREGVNAQTLMPGFKQAVSNMARPTDELREKFDKLGISLDQGFEKGLADTFKTLEGMKDETKAAALAADVFGTRAGPDMAAAIQEGRFELDEMMRTFNSGKDTIRDAGRDTMDLDEHWQVFTNNLKVLVRPQAEKVFGFVSDEMKGLTKIMGDDRLSGEEKFDAFLDRLGELARKAIPKAAEAGGKIGITLLKGVAGAWEDANPLTKLFIGAGAIRLFGGRGALLRAGAGAGHLLGVGVASGAATTVAGGAGAGAGAAGGAAGGGLIGSMRSKLLPVAKRAGLVGLGVILADGVISEFSRQAAIRSDDMWEALESKGAPNFIESATSFLDPFKFLPEDMHLSESKQELGELIDVMRDLQSQGKHVRLDIVEDFRRLSSGIEFETDAAADAFRVFQGKIEKRAHRARQILDAELNIRDIRYDWDRDLKQMTGLTDSKLSRIERLLETKPRKGEKALAKAFDNAAKAIDRAMTRGEIGTRKGLQLIHGMLNKEMQAKYGISHGDAERILQAKGAGKDYKGGLATGGITPGGFASGYSRTDDRLIAVRGGEAVLRPEDHVPTVDASMRMTHGIGLRDYLKRTGGKVDGFAPGGIASFPELKPPARALAQDLAGKGFHPTSTYRSTSTTYHGTGEAIDYGDSINSMPALWSLLRPRVKQLAELFGPSRLGSPTLFKHGTPFSDAGLQAGHEDHIHTAITAMIGALAGGALKLPRFQAGFGAYGPNAAGLNNIAAGLEKEMARRAQAQPAHAPGDVQGGNFLSTAYGPPWGGINGMGITATGVNLLNAPKRHLIAVDPSVIPLHSKVKVWPNPFGYRGPFEAEDTGGAIKGNRIDFYDWRGRSSQLGWGERNVDVDGFVDGGIVEGFAKGGVVGRIRKLHNKLARTDSPKRRREIERNIRKLERTLKGDQKKGRRKRLTKIDQQGAMKADREKIAASQLAVDRLNDQLSGLAVQHGFTEPRDVSAILEELGLDPDVELSELTPDQRAMLTGEVNADYSVEKGEQEEEADYNLRLLDALLALRGQLLGSISKAEERIESTEDQIERAKEKRKDAGKLERKHSSNIRKLTKQLEDVRKKKPPKRMKGEKPKAYRQRLEKWRNKHRERITLLGDRLGKQRFAKRQAQGLERYFGNVLEVAKENHGELGEFKEDSSASLIQVQGLNAPMSPKVVLRPLSGGVPQFGGEILDVQARLQQLGSEEVVRPKLDFSGPEEDPAEPAEPTSPLRIDELLKFAEAVKYAGLDSFAGEFATGGYIPPGKWGIAGETGEAELVRGGASGARVLSPSETREVSRRDPQVSVNFADGMGWLREFMQVEIDGRVTELDRQTHEVAMAGRRGPT